MNVLFVTDVHMSESALAWSRDAAARYDAVIVGGDLEMGGRSGFAARFLGELLSSARAVYYVPGNADAPDIEIPDGVVKLHGRRERIDRMTIGGLGGSNVTGMNTTFELQDSEARSILSSLGRVDILVSHCPPAKTKCDMAGGRHIGSLPVREYIEREDPAVVLSGHAHESRAIDRLGGTTVVNPGPLMEGKYAVLNLGAIVSVELKSGAF
jgi:Icc-related predicted phosphoesterase